MQLSQLIQVRFMKGIIAIFILSLVTSGSICAQTNIDQKFPLVIEFVSYCCGVPDNKPIINFARSFRRKYKTKAISAYKIGPAGKEGEYYLAFPLKELNKNQVKSFIKGIERVTITPEDKGGLIYQKNYTIDSSHFSKLITAKENAIKI